MAVELLSQLAHAVKGCSGHRPYATPAPPRAARRRRGVSTLPEVEEPPPARRNRRSRRRGRRKGREHHEMGRQWALSRGPERDSGALDQEGFRAKLDTTSPRGGALLTC